MLAAARSDEKNIHGRNLPERRGGFKGASCIICESCPKPPPKPNLPEFSVSEIAGR